MPGSLKKTGGEFIRFFIVGVGATLLHMGVYIAVNSLFGITQETPLAWNASYMFGYAVSFIANYIVTLKWTFRTEGSVKKGAGFAFSHGFNLGLQVLLLNLFALAGVGGALVAAADWLCPWAVAWFPFLGRAESLLPLPVYCIVVPTNFLMVRFFVRRP